MRNTHFRAASWFKCERGSVFVDARHEISRSSSSDLELQDNKSYVFVRNRGRIFQRHSYSQTNSAKRYNTANEAIWGFDSMSLIVYLSLIRIEPLGGYVGLYPIRKA
jgi:hypothetical protein